MHLHNLSSWNTTEGKEVHHSASYVHGGRHDVSLQKMVTSETDPSLPLDVNY